MVRQLIIIIVLTLAASGVRAQLSPGDLNRVHASLEGVENCTNCHSGDQELVPDKCLTCHARIQNQRTAGKGLHSRLEYQACQKCHVEHQGRDVALIYWKNSETAFDHSLVGYKLEGKHTSLDCRRCHQAKFIGGLTPGAKEQIDSSRTYLGLRAACVSCHRDEHRGQLNPDCTKCHDQTGWKPVGRFDHATAKFILTGKHQTVVCAKCHRLMTDRPLGDDSDYVQFTGLSFAQCNACHTDTHKGKLGDNCSSCHTSEGWKIVNTVNFDHSKTRYPLEGRHLAVDCGKCHGEGQAKQGLKFSSCRDCHSDYHRGEFARRASKGNCEECHTVKGYVPAQFTMAQHDQTRYPLRGSHLAVPCLACHKPAVERGTAVLSFAYASTLCQACHKDPHRGQVDKLVAVDGCELCHAVETWNRVNYDHSKSNFPLEGGHTKVACNKCHADMASTSDLKAVRFTGIRTDCQSCHADIHRGQFTSDKTTDCSRCHSPANWKATKFDHLTSRFKLDGAHRSVACDRCHQSITDEAGRFVRYKPVDTSCASCHGTTLPERSS
jgi:hypothetical protein